MFQNTEKEVQRKKCDTYASNNYKDFCQHILLISSESLSVAGKRLCVGKEVKSRFSHLEKSSLNFSSSRFVIRVNLLHS